jgi:hypothetical protein
VIASVGISPSSFRTAARPDPDRCLEAVFFGNTTSGYSAWTVEFSHI